MFKELFSNRLFIGALAFFVLCVGGSLLYMHHETQKGAEYAAETEERVRQWNEKQKEEPPAEAPVVEQPEQVGHVHEDGTRHEEAHEQVGVAQAPQTETPQPQEAFSPEEDARSTANLLDHLETYIPLAEETRDILKRSYERLRKEKEYSDAYSQRTGRRYPGEARILKRLAEAKADLDAKEQDIANLKKWRDEHVNK